jgi:hypothetical protein
MLIVSPEAAAVIAFANADAPLYSIPVRTFFVWHGAGAATAADATSPAVAAASPAVNAATPKADRFRKILIR